MDLFEKISSDIKTAMKAKEADKLTALRAVKAELLLMKTSGNKKITEDDEIKTLQKLVKQRKESADLYKTNGRDDLYKIEITEATFIQEYLPKQLSEDELTSVIKEIIAKVGATSMKDMGKVMGIASKELAGKAEGKLLAAKVKSLL